MPPALQWLKKHFRGTAWKIGLLTRALLANRPLPEDEAALSRLGLASPDDFRGHVLRRFVALGLAATR